MGFKGTTTTIVKLLLALCAFVFTNAASYAMTNSLSGIDVKQNADSQYEILLKLDKFSDVTKYSDAKDSLTVVIDSVVPTEDVEIVYDSASDMKNIIVQKKNVDNTVISLQGKNIENATILTKELSTGIVKQNNSKLSFLANYIYIADKKLFALSLLSLVMFFVFTLSLRPKNKRYKSENLQTKKIKNSKKQTINTISKKRKVSANAIPSINYNINGSFANAQQNMSVPKEFVINKYNEEQIRKVG